MPKVIEWATYLDAGEIAPIAVVGPMIAMGQMQYEGDHFFCGICVEQHVTCVMSMGMAVHIKKSHPEHYALAVLAS